MTLTSITTNCWKIIGIFGDSSCPELSVLIHCRNCKVYNNAGRGLFDRDVPVDFVEESTKLISVAKEQELKGYLSVIVFRVGEEWLALKTIYLQEITSLKPVHRVPYRTNDIFRGIANINGELLLCISLVRLLEHNHEEEDTQNETNVFKRMIVINKNGERYVFSVDEVLGIFRISLNEIKEPPVTLMKSPSNLIEGIFELLGNKVGFLGDDRFLSALKRGITG
ncbi:MAG TPA: chemotaxis protein CheW [Syntrophorhabdaceae bacterium]|nr:chemotaxis protein CheW [Syntrophorhabdaceae bacterium]